MLNAIINRISGAVCPWPAAVLAVAAILAAPAATAGETDQYLTWEIELADAAPVFNAYLDQEIHAFVDKMNRRSRPPESAEALTIALYQHLFAGLHASRVRNWLKNDADVARFPDNSVSDWEYQRMSIFREPAFPFVLPMAQTIRVGEVYLGIDKIGHMLGFGRRYFQIYQRARDEGATHDAAVDRVLNWGIQHERGVVGKLVDGIFSKGDIEANYQGFLLALSFCSGNEARFYREGGLWRYRGGLDIRDYITPDFDESYYPNDYASWRAKRVLPIVEARYAPLAESPTVVARFARYARGYTPSRSKVFVDAWLDKSDTARHASVAQK